MTDANDKKTKSAPLTLSRPKLELKKTVDVGRVHQSFTAGRSKPVQVEVRKKRSFVTDAHGNIQGVKEETNASELLDSEKAHRLKVLKDAIKADEENRIKAEEEARQRAEEEAKRAAQEAERKAKEEAEQKRRAAENPPKETPAAPVAAPVKKEEHKKPFADKKPAAAQPAVSPEDAEAAENRRMKTSFKRREMRDDDSRTHARRGGGEDKWRGGRINMSALMRGDDDEGRGRSLASIKRAREKERQKMSGPAKPAEKVYREVVIPETITVQELAARMSDRGADVV